jgi:hypothetical protein
MLTPAVFLGDDEDIIWDFWEDAWAVGTLREPHLLTATQILVQQDEMDMNLFRAMPAIGTLPATMPAPTHVSMADFGHLIGNFGQVMHQPRNVRLQAINVILNTVVINPVAGRGFWCTYKGGGCCLAGPTPAVVAEQLYDKYPTNEAWCRIVILKPNV